MPDLIAVWIADGYLAAAELLEDYVGPPESYFRGIFNAEVTCPDCGGDGEKHCEHCGNDYECRRCEGSGYITAEDAEDVTVDILHDVPEELAERLCAQGCGDQWFGDGYEAAQAAAPYVADGEPVVSSIYDQIARERGQRIC